MNMEDGQIIHPRVAKATANEEGLPDCIVHRDNEVVLEEDPSIADTHTKSRAELQENVDAPAADAELAVVGHPPFAVVGFSGLSFPAWDKQ